MTSLLNFLNGLDRHSFSEPGSLKHVSNRLRCFVRLSDDCFDNIVNKGCRTIFFVLSKHSLSKHSLINYSKIAQIVLNI